MKKHLLVISATVIWSVFSLGLVAQNVDNRFSGYYQASNDSLPYSFFSFDNNGKVNISDFAERDYFVKGDTVIIIPSKSLFKLLIVNNSLVGVSEWVDKNVWTKIDTTIADKRDSGTAKHRAELLSEYYEKTRSGNVTLEMLTDSVLKKEYYATIDDLCSRGLVMACMEEFGIKFMEDLGGINAALSSKNKPIVKENPALVALARRIISLGDLDGHVILAQYYCARHQYPKAKNEYLEAMGKGRSNLEPYLKRVILDEKLLSAKKKKGKTTTTP